MSSPRVLIVDDDPTLLELLRMRLEIEGMQVMAAASGEEAVSKALAQRPDLVVTDLQMAGMDGVALYESLERRYPGLPVIILTAHGSIPHAVASTRKGVFGYLPKPFEAQTLLDEVRRALTAGGAATGPQTGFGDLSSRNPGMQALLATARTVAASNASVLITGPSGSGKEVLARAVHRHSPRAGGEFVAVNCAAFPEALLESELFGYVKGAFTGAQRDHTGLVASAGGGTLFLDEIGDMPLPLQAKLLRVLQEREVRPVGGTRAVKVDVRVLAATHRDLRAAVAEKTFREDLFYRLNVVALALPALDARREDIADLGRSFLSELAAHHGKPVRTITAEAMDLLVRAAWPGNVRQLRNCIERLVVLSAGETIDAALVARALEEPAARAQSLDDARTEFERDFVARLLTATGGNVTEAARQARRNRSEFYVLLKRLGLDPADFKPR